MVNTGEILGQFMTIRKGAPIARRNGEPSKGIQIYTWDRYESNKMFNHIGKGNNKPTLAQLNASGYLLQAETEFDSLTHKLVEPYADSWQDDGVYVTRKTIKLTGEEVSGNAVSAFNEKVKSMTDAVQAHLDTTAQSWGYDNIISLCTYDGNSDLKYSAEGAAGKEWRSSVWRYCEDELASIATGIRQEPESNEAFIAELPTIVRPKI